MSTFLSTGLCVALLVASGCAGRGTAGASDEQLQLLALADTIPLAPSEQASVSFRLDNGVVPVAGRTVSFAITPNDAAQGATLTAPSAMTDASGLVSVGVRAGLPTSFQISAQVGTKAAQVMVVVSAAGFGNVAVVPFFAPASTAAQHATSIRVLFYDRASCSGVDPDDPPAPTRDPASLAVGQQAFFTDVSTDSSSAVFAEAMGPGPTILAIGCVDVPGPALQPGLRVQVSVPLTDAVPDPVGSFALTSTLAFAPPLAAAAAVAKPWADLSDCPLDPAQLWLDCTIDALSTATPADPLDCVPATGAGAEGAVGDAINARRGAWLVDASGATTTCRGAQTSGGVEGLDAIVLGLFGTPAPPAVAALSGVAADAASILQAVQLSSSLDIMPGSQPGTYVVTHTLESAQFGPGFTVSVPLAPLGLPVLQAVTSGSIVQGDLAIAAHGFTLRLGTTARAAFGPLALAPRSLPPDITTFVQMLFAQAQGPGSATGCAALDATVCPAVGQPAGCLSSACATGLKALTGILDGAFLAADGPGLDLQLSGTAPMIAIPGGLRAQRLGMSETPGPTEALWSASVGTTLGTATLAAPFEGLRN
ncbi:MAG TPA: hypothetical protein VMT03_22530 [Polyangia bacterium]|nr:hypothetical protein [Polyangia bacterium]